MGTITKKEENTLPEVKSVIINGECFHYIEMGKGDPVVFVHGGLGDYRTWEGQMDTFAKNHHVISYSRRFAYPNKQVIDDSADYSLPNHANDLVEFLKSLNLRPVHLVGHSFGGAIALLATLNHPELVRSLTLAEPAVLSLLLDVPGGDILLTGFVNSLIPATNDFLNNDNEEAVKKFLACVTGDSLYFINMSTKGQRIMMDNWLELRGLGINKILPAIDCDSLKKIKTPVLLLSGERSPLFLKTIIKELYRCLLNRDEAMLSNTSHGLEYENPTEFNKAVLSFINKY